MLNEKDMKKLEGVNPLLISVVGAAAHICPLQIFVIEGLRDKARQKMLYEAGKSKTMNSRHLLQSDGYGGAVDLGILIDGKADWNYSNFVVVANAMKKAAMQLGAEIEWGGECFGPRFIDAVHFQLKRGGKNV